MSSSLGLDQFLSLGSPDVGLPVMEVVLCIM